MGDDNEIRDLIHREAEEFISKARTATRDLHASYDFEAEFAKTRKNRSLLVPLVTILTIAALGLVSWGVTSWIQQRNDAAPVELKAFEDLNLKDLLDTAKRNENDMKKAQSELAQLQFDERASLDSVDREYTTGLDTIRARAPSKAEEDRQAAASKTAWVAKRRQLEAGFAPRFAAKRAEIRAIQAKIDKYDQRLMQQANEQKAILDSAQQAFAIEKQRQATDYEKRIADLQAQRKRDIASLVKQRDDLAASLTARYNPVLGDPRSSALLGGWKPPASYGPFAGLPDYLVAQGLLQKAEADRLDASLADLSYLLGKLRAVPWINSVPAALSRVEGEALGSIAGYRSALDRSASGLVVRDRAIADREQTIADREQTIADRERSIAEGLARERSTAAERDSLDWAIANHALQQRESGYIVDPRDSGAITVVMNPSTPVSDGALAYVVRGDKTVASVRLSVAGEDVTAAVVEMFEGESVLPFDSLLVRTDAESSK